MSFAAIDRIFNIAILNTGLDIDIVIENDGHKTDGDPYLACYQLPVPVTQATLGANGCDLHSGIYQINIKYPDGKGKTEALEMADTLNAIFYSGAQFTESPISVKIKTTSIERADVSGGYITIPLSIEWYSHIERI